MSQARVEYVHLGEGLRFNGWSQNVIRKVVGSLAPIDATATATAGSARPVIPSGDGVSPLYALVRAVGGAVIVAWGDDPSAATTGEDQKWIGQDEEALIPVQAGQLLSFLDPNA